MDLNRYDRNILLKGMGQEGQEKLSRSKVLVVGAGGLGSPVLYYLAAAGIGTLGIVDFDVVDISNLQRQIIHRTADLGVQKAFSASQKLKALNPDLNCVVINEKFTEENAGQIIRDYDFVVDCCDNYTAKFLINDACVREGKAYSHGAVMAWGGEAFTYVPGSPCYQCIYGLVEDNKGLPTSAQTGILGAVAGVIGSVQATETVKYLTGAGKLLTGQLLVFDGLTMTFNKLSFEPNPDCIVCQYL